MSDFAGDIVHRPFLPAKESAESSNYYDEKWYCGDCDECMDFDCTSHPDNEWRWSLEAYESKFCSYSFGAFNVGDEFCEFCCSLRDACEELWEKSQSPLLTKGNPYPQMRSAWARKHYPVIKRTFSRERRTPL